MVSIVVPTYNENARVRTKITNLLEQDYPIDKLEIVIIDNSTDETPQVVAEMRVSHPSVIRLIREPKMRGLATALDLGYRSAHGSIIVKSDCDARLLNDDSLKRAVSYLTSPDVGSVTGAYAPLEKSEQGYRSILHKLQLAESNLDSTPIAHGAFLAFRKSLYRGISPQSLADDTEIALDVRRQGFRALLVPEILSVEDHPSKSFTAIKQRSRRARGILRLYAGKGRGMVLNPKFGRLGVVVLPLEIALMTIVPAACVGLCLLALYMVWAYFGLTVAMASALSGLVVMLITLNSRTPISGLAVAEISSLIGLALLPLPQSGIYERTRN